jgi:hypothetical protein
MKKNTAGQRIGVQMTSAADGSNFTGATTVFVTGDAGTQAIGTVGAGVCTHEGLGYHTYTPSQAETNFDLIAFTFTGAGAITASIQLYTDTAATPNDVNAELVSYGALQPTVAGRTLDVSATGGAGVDWGNVENQSTPVNLSSTNIDVDQIIASVTGNVNGSVGSIATGGIVALSFDAAALLAIADALLKRDMAAVSGEAARSPLNAFRFLRNKWEVVAGVITIKKEDDTTTAWTGATTGTLGALPITAVDPT